MKERRLKAWAGKHIAGFARAMEEAAVDPDVSSPLLDDGTRPQLFEATGRLKRLAARMDDESREGR